MLKKTLRAYADGVPCEHYNAPFFKTWAWLRAAAGNQNFGGVYIIVGFNFPWVPPLYLDLYRGIALFDVSSQLSPIRQATFIGYGLYKEDLPGALPDLNLYSANPASNTEIVAGDYDSLGSVPYCDTPIAYGDFVIDGWNSFILNAVGLAALNAAIAGDGIFKVGFRDVTHDVLGTPPTGIWGGEVSALYFASFTQSGQEPKLVISRLGGNILIDQLIYQHAERIGVR